MDEVTVLYMYFLDEIGKKVSISIPSPRIDLVDSEVKSAMDTIIAKNIFLSGTLDLITAHSAKIVTKTTSELELE